ncbi:hypothetical protein OG320_03010 [Microbispora sp. NBC_01189]|uniref:Uncharacterized protein n=2 Tax=Microbispora triticiradicis TaxID=2200763 RepID=A0A5R8YIG4_9ACTN|nr:MULTISPECIES: hypothetical protein [Microbispora]RGA02674.1 hypothetical protein DI270_023225 [Microbispora triticiradicis]TLP52354.1 hypothetical protein FED44_32095 [Microbispora fusca]WSS07615.1 hypothetical protein OG320_03010 [Microbispora sp. NBC_01189]GLW20593.1 hypothetical protein Mame01_06360 [Microbispora amethystogenes]
MIKTLHKIGLRSNMMYGAAFGSIGMSIASWIISNKYEQAGIERADRWALFVGEWAPTFFAMGIALQLEEMSEEKGRETPEWQEQSSDIRRPTRAGV